jgi:hypothetical protein
VLAFPCAASAACRAVSVHRVKHFCRSRQLFLPVVARLKGSFRSVRSRAVAAIFGFGPPWVECSFSEERL